jgi:hypothetical protein
MAPARKPVTVTETPILIAVIVLWGCALYLAFWG